MREAPFCLRRGPKTIYYTLDYIYTIYENLCTEDHLKEDLQIFDFSLADEEVLQLSDMSTSVAGLSLPK